MFQSRPLNQSRPAGNPGFPGQSSNPVGFAATTAALPAFTTPTAWPGGSWPGPWPGSFTGGSPTITSGSAGNPNIYSFVDFTNPIDLTNLHDITFVGCRWQISQNSNFSAQMGGNSCQRISFFYCSFQPAIATAGALPPLGGGYATWPTGGWGTNNTDVDTTYQLSSTLACYVALELFSHSVNLPPIGLIQVDHCDFWGCGASIAQSGGGSGGTVITDCWIHDIPYGLPNNGPPFDWHTNGIADTNYGDLSNVTVRHCTVASMANTNGLAHQQNGSCHYTNIIVDNSYWSGFGYTICCGYTTGMTPSQTLVSNYQFTNNIIATGSHWTFFAIYGDESAIFISNTNANGNRWKNNTFSVIPGTSAGGSQSPFWVNGNDGQFILPDTGFSSTDWP